MNHPIFRFLESPSSMVIPTPDPHHPGLLTQSHRGYNFLNSCLICNTTASQKLKLLSLVLSRLGPVEPGVLASLLETPLSAQAADQSAPEQTTALNLAARYLPARELTPLFRRLARAGYRPGPDTLASLEHHLNGNHHNSPGDIAELLVVFV
ncbi:hypothetical protein [Spirochaeta lutea]|uniref:Uncharacterized protein n=1 Tax=Spirochaeta lutea TaxID=1480694 RepID=A0A098QZE3_9SPIO|nr:hypothetical protein [Spirochaeta lutea]KGE73280.1 hypothetical protein DC28_04750 [Spirochaeta lutea]